MVSLVQNFLAVWVCLILIPRFFLPKLFTHVNNLFIYLHEKLVFESFSSKLCHFSIEEFHFSYSFPKTVLSLTDQWICEFKFFINWFWHLCSDEFSRDPLTLDSSVEGDEKPIDPISDIGIDRINDAMFNNSA